ncbi:hypothetical protein N186_03700 [Thermofilum adornatum]|uniref:DEAD/DEAH box helicase n=1 Tax=Thermofilum adornatum TaxID=1365176 RepID=S6A5H8_9CREN|nr:helicase-related protein [Thermofilum adornatum]AGT35102.1 hypothetical protein N186_03700 [Thermofilum adornatum]
MIGISITREKNYGETYFLKSLLICLGGYFDKKQYNNKIVERKKPTVYVYDSNGYKWSMGHLFEVEGEVAFEGYNVEWKWDKFGLQGINPINCLLAEDDQGNRFKFRDWNIAKEPVFSIEASEDEVKESLRNLIYEAKQFIRSGVKHDDIEIVGSALQYSLEQLGIKKLYKYQEAALKKISLTLLGLNTEKRHFAIVARTSGGKTYAFLLPLIFASAIYKAKGHKGCKAILFYPTKALANDQADELAHLLWYFNDYLRRQKREDLTITMGILHGNIKSRFASGEDKPEVTMIKCPIHERPLTLYFERQEEKFSLEKLSCDYEDCPVNRDSDWVNKWIKLTREAIYSEPPDILLTDQDMINAVLMRNPSELTIIGYSSVKVCKKCGSTYPVQKRKCRCGSTELIPMQKLGHPIAIVLDEAHMLRGSFGIQTYYLLKRLEQAIRTYHNELPDWRPTYIISSATIHSPKMFAASLLGEDAKSIEVFEANYDKGVNVKSQRIFLFLMPKTYEMQATCIRAIGKLYDLAKEKKPQTIVFVNSLAESNELWRGLNDEIANIQGIRVGGHTTDYEQDRIRIEQDFSKKVYQVLVATKTLEVGVDYGSLDVAVIHGMPFYISDFTQRIGRAGRNRDALIIVIFDPQTPIDYYYYQNYRLLCDPALRSDAMSLESYTIKSNNQEAIRRTITRAIFDYLSVASEKINIGKLYDEESAVDDQVLTRLKAVLFDERDSLHLKMINHIQGVIGSLDNNLFEDALREAIDRISQSIGPFEKSTKIESILKKIDNIYQIYNLRHAEKAVLFKFSPSFGSASDTRPRELSTAIRRASRGQVISFRGIFYVVKMIEGNTVNIKSFLEDG